MRILGIHTDNFFVKTGEKAIEGAEALKPEEHEINFLLSLTHYVNKKQLSA